MALTERERHDAYEALTEAFGDRTDNVIQMFQTDRDQLATKDDLALTRTELRTEMAGLRTEMADLRTELKTEMADLRTELKTEMADLRTELKTEMSGLRAAFHQDITAAFQAQTRTMMIGLISALVLIAITNSLAIALG